MSKSENVIMWTDDLRMTQNRRVKLKETILMIQKVIDISDKLKNSYFWGPPGIASIRRRLEDKYTADASWSENGHDYTAHIGCTMSCNHVYVDRQYKKDGVKTNLTAVKASLRRLEQINKRADERAKKKQTIM